jgi:hypothetical protein
MTRLGTAVYIEELGMDECHNNDAEDGSNTSQFENMDLQMRQ